MTKAMRCHARANEDEKVNTEDQTLKLTHMLEFVQLSRSTRGDSLDSCSLVINRTKNSLFSK